MGVGSWDSRWRDQEAGHSIGVWVGENGGCTFGCSLVGIKWIIVGVEVLPF